MYTSLIMNSEALMHEFVSRPKINRLPLPPVRGGFGYSGGVDADIFKWLLWMATSLIVVFVIYQYINSLFVKTSSVPDDTHLMEIVNSPVGVADDMKVTKSSDSTLYFRDNDSIIVGSMVKIAYESEEMIPDKVYNNSNATTESELLSILSKY